jgi:hypothetical protein
MLIRIPKPLTDNALAEHAPDPEVTVVESKQTEPVGMGEASTLARGPASLRCEWPNCLRDSAESSPKDARAAYLVRFSIWAMIEIFGKLRMSAQ